MTPETFSETRDSSGFTAQCDPDIIPIFPLRFAFKEETLIGMLSSKAQIPAPQSINNHPDHELLRIRKGYVYVFDGATFQIFHFNTFIDDENGSISRADTPESNGAAYTFRKYTWTEESSTAPWKLESKTYPYVFVPTQTPKAWIAYTETRWPYRYFYEAEKKLSFVIK